MPHGAWLDGCLLGRQRWYGGRPFSRARSSCFMFFHHRGHCVRVRAAPPPKDMLQLALKITEAHYGVDHFGRTVYKRALAQASSGTQAELHLFLGIVRGDLRLVSDRRTCTTTRRPPSLRGCLYLRGVLCRRRFCTHSVRRLDGEDLELRHRRVPPYACRALLQPQSLRASRDGPPRGITLPRQVADGVGA